MKKVYIISVLCIVIGCLFFLFPLLLNYVNQSKQNQIIIHYNQCVEGKKEETIYFEFEKAHQFNQMLAEGLSPTDDFYKSCLNINKDDIMGYIQIKKINVFLPIYHYANDSTMSVGVGHVKNSSLPIGEIGHNSVLTSHNGMFSAKMFSDLDRLKPGDSFEIFVLDQELQYKVVNILKVLPNEVQELKRLPDKDTVTLITCVPFGINSHRLLVIGERVM